MHLNMEPFGQNSRQHRPLWDTEERQFQSCPRFYIELKAAYPFGKRFTLKAKGATTTIYRETHMRGSTLPPSSFSSASARHRGATTATACARSASVPE